MSDDRKQTVHLETFHGPLDLLLQLIVRAELEITAISLADVADQYVSKVSDLGGVDVDDAGEFLLIAATLIELKSRVLSPQPVQEEPAERTPSEGPIDTAEKLVRSLLAYRAYREAGDLLEQRREAWLRRYPAVSATIDHGALHEAARSHDGEDLEDLGLYDLVKAFRSIAQTVQFDRLGEHQVEDDDVPIELAQADLIDELERRGEAGGTSLRAIVSLRTKAQAVGLFIGLLELVRQRRLRVEQAEGDDVRLWLREPEEADPLFTDA